MIGAFVALSAAEPKLGSGDSRTAASIAAALPVLPPVATAPELPRAGELPSLDLPHLPHSPEVAEPAPPESEARTARAPAAAGPVSVAMASASLEVIEGVLGESSTLTQALTARGVSHRIVALIAREMEPYFDFRHARPGHEFRLAHDGQGSVVDFRYRTSETAGYRMVREGNGFQVRREEALLEPRATRIAGVVSSTLYKAITDLGERGQLARDFAEVFAWDIDFQRSVQPGDGFEILYERLFLTEPDGETIYVRPGRILAARYEGTAGHHTAVYFEPQEGRGGYYRLDGTSVRGAFLMAPLRHARISSAYSSARRHPILKVVRPHHGIDYAAPHGTPVWAVADGEVIYRARAGGFGNLVKIRHANGYVSYYAHLSRFAKGLRTGERVEQKQLIGYVGSTGLATGPHVCFRVARNGRYVNPARIKTPAGEPIPKELLPTFAAATSLLISELGGETQLATDF